MLLNIIAFIIVLGVLILVHELGHFITAKLSGVKVEEFSIGFPPRIASIKRGETRYTIGLLPLGGYVKMLGEDESSKDPRAFNNQSPTKRLIIGIAGVVMNFVLAWVILSIGFAIGMTPVATPSDQIGGEKVKPQIYVVEVTKGSPAEAAGLKPGDQLISADNITFKSPSDVSSFTAANLGQEVDFTVKNESSTVVKKIKISDNKAAPLGVGIVDQSVVKVAWYKAPLAGIRETYGILKYTFVFLGGFARQLFGSGSISDQVGGPVAIFTLSGMAAKAGIIALLQFIAVLSVNLGLVNILPLPALDGGRVLFVLLEKIAGKRVVKENVEGIIHMIGFALLILLIIAITYKDIIRLVRH